MGSQKIMQKHVLRHGSWSGFWCSSFSVWVWRWCSWWNIDRTSEDYSGGVSVELKLLNWTAKNVMCFIKYLQCKPQQRYCLLRDCLTPRRCNVLCRPQRLQRSPACAGHHPSRSVCQESCAAHGLHRTTWQRRWKTTLLDYVAAKSEQLVCK